MIVKNLNKSLIDFRNNINIKKLLQMKILKKVADIVEKILDLKY